MPTRAISHQLEDLSKDRFRLLLPRAWVFRDKSHDYGIDGEVELFSEDGTPLSLMFYVQLKATEFTDSKMIMSVRLKIDTVKYFHGLDVPVLLVRYSSYDDKFYVLWVNSIDLYYSRKGSKSYKIQFNDSHIWTSRSAKDIKTYLSQIREVKSGDFKYPVKLGISKIDESITGIPKVILLSRFRDELAEYNEIIVFESDTFKALIKIELWLKEIKVCLPESGGVVFNIESSQHIDNTGNGIKQLVKLVVTGFAIWLIINNRAERGFSILNDNKLLVDMLKMETMANTCLPNLIRSCFFQETLNTLLRVIKESSQNQVCLFAISTIARYNTRGDRQRQNAFGAFLEELVSFAEQCWDRDIVGAYYYNLGNHYGCNRQYREAFHCYWVAKKNEPEYLKREYYFTEVASVLFNIGKYRLSSKLYGISIEKGAPISVVPKFADALMHAGKYRDSFQQFETYFKMGEEYQGDEYQIEWELKYYALDYMINCCNVEDQNRRVNDALVFANKVGADDDSDFANLAIALDIDALCGLAWFNRGSLCKNHQDWGNAAMSFLICGLIQPRDVEAWLGAVLSIFYIRPPVSFFANVIVMGYINNGDSYLTELYRIVLESLDADLGDQFTKIIEDLITKYTTSVENRDRFVIRVNGELLDLNCEG